jgi:hypothetical protein
MYSMRARLARNTLVAMPRFARDTLQINSKNRSSVQWSTCDPVGPFVGPGSLLLPQAEATSHVPIDRGVRLWTSGYAHGMARTCTCA